MITKTIFLILFIGTVFSCGHINLKISDVKISFPGKSLSDARIDFNTSEISTASVKFWKSNEQEKALITEISDGKKNHSFLLSNLLPGEEYKFNIITSDGPAEKSSNQYSFKTIDFTTGIKDTFNVEYPETTSLPASFQQGYVMVYRRECPGIVYLLDVNANVVWYYQVKDAGFKAVKFTDSQTFLALLGSKSLERGYGDIILELSPAGDTLLYLKKGQNDFKQTIHHEILLNPKNEIVTLCNEEKIVDLRSRGGLPRDTVHGDGILVLDRQGHQRWKWSIFDVLDPIKDKNILKNKSDWMHANSIAFDLDGNYLVSFYNNNQIWKIDAATGQVIWKFGKNGDFDIPIPAQFDQAHAVHVNEQGWLLFFDNGTSRRLSRAMAFKLDESSRKAQLLFSVWLPPNLYTERMGSSYLVSENHLLNCTSGAKAVVLTNLRGEIIWQLNARQLRSYRAEFIPRENIDSYFANGYVKN